MFPQVTGSFSAWNDKTKYKERIERVLDKWRKVISESTMHLWKETLKFELDKDNADKAPIVISTVSGIAFVDADGNRPSSSSRSLDSSKSSPHSIISGTSDAMHVKDLRPLLCNFLNLLFGLLKQQYMTHPDHMNRMESTLFSLDAVKVSTFWFVHHYLDDAPVPLDRAITVALACVYLSGKVRLCINCQLNLFVIDYIASQSEYLFLKAERLRKAASVCLQEREMQQDHGHSFVTPSNEEV
jgi:hypothetical protein